MGTKRGGNGPLKPRILAAAVKGGTADATDLPEDERHVDADWLRALYLGRHRVTLDPRGPLLVGVHIDGDLDLSHTAITVPIRTRACTYYGRVDLTAATTRSVELRTAALDHVLAEGARIEGALQMTGATVHNRELALHLLRAELTGSALLDDRFRCAGSIIATGIRVGGQFNLAGATLTYGGPDAALALNGARISGSVRLSDGFSEK